MTDLKHKSKSVLSVNLAEARAAGAGDSVVDTTGASDAQLVAVLGATVGTGTITLVESDTEGGSYTQAVDSEGNDIAIAYTSADADSIKTLEVENINLANRKRYFRLDTTGAATDIAGYVQLGGLHSNPSDLNDQA